jgi:predicted HTH transcriptional regulator
VSHYPHAPGWKAQDTAIEAARLIESRADTLRAKAYELFKRGFELTPDECAKRLREEKLAIRPRITELFKMNLIIDSGERRRNESGRFAIVYRIHPNTRPPRQRDLPL